MSPRLSLHGEIEQREGLVTALALAGLYLGALRSHEGPGETRRTLDVLLVSAALAAAYALLQIAGFDPLRWAHEASYPSGGGAMLRPFGTLGNPILLGAVLAAALSLGIARLALGDGDPWRTAPLVALFSVTLAATLSRGAWLAAAAGALVACAGAVALGGRRVLSRVALALGASVVPGALWGLFVLRAPLMARLAEGAHAVSSPARGELARAAFELARTHPWLGTGPDTFGLAFPSVMSVAYFRTEWLGMPVHAHSAALQALATGGVLACLAGLAWLAGPFLALARARRAEAAPRPETLALGATLASLAVSGAVNVVGLAGAAVFVTLAALAVGESRAAAPEAFPRPASRVAIPLVVAVAVVVVSFGGMRALAAAGRARAALETAITLAGPARSAVLDEAGHAAELAAARAPRDEEIRRLACDVALARAAEAIARGDAPAADSLARLAEGNGRLAVLIEPRRAANHDRAANALALRARLERSPALANLAAGEFAEARRLAPVDALVLVDEASAWLALGAMPQALESAARIATLYPDAAIGHALSGAAWLGLGMRGPARGALTRALAARWEEGSEAQRRAAEERLRALSSPDSTR